MVEFKDFDETKLYDYTSDNLKMFINEIEMKLSVLREKCVSEMAVYLEDERFDPYSFFGKRKLQKIAKRHNRLVIGANEYLRIIKNELAKREKLEDEMRYSGRSIKQKPISEEEFLQREQDKTMAYKAKNGIDSNNEQK